MVSFRRLVDLSEDELDAVVQVLLAAFKDDVGMSSLSGNSTRVLADICRRTVRACSKVGEVHVGLVDGRIQSVVAWTAPGQDWQCYQQADFMANLSSYLNEWYMYHYQPTYEDLYATAFSAGERTRRDALYLNFLAVHPDHQHRRIGKQLLSFACKQADATAKRMVVDVKSPFLVSWFRKSGFIHRAVKNFSSRDSAGFPLWCMVREPEGKR
ncbi:uncharacterized protein BXZ73DRAFT_102250 [Epithele typhae]|uniref:uncharacterized protein n=1 Tax=Epithele typhae TaxID=378194 RepID=UPI002008BB6D|nr:uncharacterized protein BXZ73DRAFT_102250 [Epithele typhae]KAH9929096.1 hypothetical protein BXZ73DRAFT_102250 [Epithele typhae]